MMNQSIIVGRIANVPEVKELENDSKVCNLTIAVPRSYKNENGEYETDFIDCSLWNGVADNTANYCHKGDVVGIKGRIQTRVVETDKGKHKEQYLVAEKVTFLSSSKNKENDEDKEMEV